nr:hypothetical protein [Gemmatimonadaceae bacterium]
NFLPDDPIPLLCWRDSNDLEFVFALDKASDQLGIHNENQHRFDFDGPLRGWADDWLFWLQVQTQLEGPGGLT